MLALALALAIGAGTENFLSVSPLDPFFIWGCESRYAKREISKESEKVVMSDDGAFCWCWARQMDGDDRAREAAGGPLEKEAAGWLWLGLDRRHGR